MIGHAREALDENGAQRGESIAAFPGLLAGQVGKLMELLKSYIDAGKDPPAELVRAIKVAMSPPVMVTPEFVKGPQ